MTELGLSKLLVKVHRWTCIGLLMHMHILGVSI